MNADRRLCITLDGTRIVEQGDPDAAFLWRGQGKPISPAEMKRFGLSEQGGKVVLPGAKSMPKPEDKMIRPAEDKTTLPTEEKSYPLHLGGGWYELSNGERVRGKEDAERAETELVE